MFFLQTVDRERSARRTAGTAYTYAVRAYKGSFKGAYTGKSIVFLTALKAAWAKNAKATGYQIQYADNSKFTDAKTVKVTGASTLTKTISGLTKGSTYYVRVRAYQTVSDVNYYSAWSAAKSVKIAK